MAAVRTRGQGRAGVDVKRRTVRLRREGNDALKMHTCQTRSVETLDSLDGILFRDCEVFRSIAYGYSVHLITLRLGSDFRMRDGLLIVHRMTAPLKAKP